MENRSHALMAGFFTLFLLAAAILGALWFGRDKIIRNSYEIATRMPVTGLNQQAAVRYKGLKVGNVTRIDFDPENPGQILLRLEILSDTPVTQSTFATLGYQGVTGIAFIQLDDQTGSTNPIVTKDDALPRIPLRAGLLQNLEQRGTAILQQTEELGQRLNQLLSDENQDSIVTAIKHIDQAAQSAQIALNTLQPTLAQLPALSNKTQASLDAIGNFASDARKLSNNLNDLASSLQAKDGAIAKLTQTVDQIGSKLDQETLPGLHSLSQDGRNSLRRVNRAVDNLSERPQSILFGNPAPLPGPGEPGFVVPQQ
jgi:phospholipid/cholesterol/gamma-HCH transport system substrate-binding protein